VLRRSALLFPVLFSWALVSAASADVISDWNEKTVAFVTNAKMAPPQAERVMTMVHVAMFDAVNAIDKRYKPYVVQPALLSAGRLGNLTSI
jgi:hypothetical protein